MARLHEPSPAIPSPRLMSIIAWGTVATLFTLAGVAFAGGMGWL